MRRSFVLTIVFFFIIHFNLLGQHNLVPNPGFESGQNTPANICYSAGEAFSIFPSCGSGSTLCTSQHQIGDDIDYWKDANLNVPCIPIPLGHSCSSADWIDITQCIGDVGFPIINYSNRFIRFGGGEGIRVQLLQKLSTNVNYVLRIKIAPLTTGEDVNIRVHLAKFGEHWNADGILSGNVKVSDIANFYINAPSSRTWRTLEANFRLGGNVLANVLENLIFIAENGTVVIDDVELFERCPESYFIQNRKYEYPDLPFQASSLLAAGSFVYNNSLGFSSGPVTVKNTADVTFKAGEIISLEDGFTAEYGSEFHAFIAPCERDCFDPIAEAGEFILPAICGLPGPNDCKQLGINNHQFGVEYVWSADPSSAISYLSDPNIPDPVFCLPNNVAPLAGTIIFTLTATNKCGQTSVDKTMINYDINNNPIAAGNPVALYDFYTIPKYELEITNITPNTEKIKIEIWKISSTNVFISKFQEFIYTRGIDFPNAANSYYWSHPNPYTLACPTSRYGVKCYFKSSCATTFPDISFDRIHFQGANGTSCSGKKSDTVSYDQISNIALNNSVNNLPNPFTGITSFQYSIQHTGVVKIHIFDALGKNICVLQSEHNMPGEYSISWDSSPLHSGVYYYLFETPFYKETKKMFIID